MREQRPDVRPVARPVASHRRDSRVPMDGDNRRPGEPRHRERSSDARGAGTSTLGIGSRYGGDTRNAIIGAAGAAIAGAYILARVLGG